MSYKKFLEQVINDGIKAVKHDYIRADQKLIKKGSIEGFESCRNKNPLELSNVLKIAQSKSHKAMLNQVKNYWYYRGFTLEVEWVCSVVSAILMNAGQPVIITPSARGVIKAAEIIGIKEH